MKPSTRSAVAQLATSHPGGSRGQQQEDRRARFDDGIAEMSFPSRHSDLPTVTFGFLGFDVSARSGLLRPSGSLPRPPCPGRVGDPLLAVPRRDVQVVGNLQPRQVPIFPWHPDLFREFGGSTRGRAGGLHHRVRRRSSRISATSSARSSGTTAFVSSGESEACSRPAAPALG